MSQVNSICLRCTRCGKEITKSSNGPRQALLDAFKRLGWFQKTGRWYCPHCRPV